ncbi:MAG: mesaconyl-C(4)-CoA hydratase [Pseudomonadota bacterium]
MATWDAWVGKSQTQDDLLTPAMLNRFRATIDSDETGIIAPQAIHFALCLPEAATASLDIDGHPKRGGFLPPVPLPRRMWASSALEFHAPIQLGDAIKRVSTIATIEEKTGGSGTLVFVNVDHQTHAGGQLAVNERQTLVYRAASTAPPAQIGTGTPTFESWQWHRAITPSEALLFRFSAITFNTHRIHYDRPYAEAEEGYRGLVVHGPLTATLLLDLAARELGYNRLKSFAFRGVSPAICGEVLHLVGKVDDEKITLAALGSDGRDVMTAVAAL